MNATQTALSTEALQARLARRVAARLTEQGERLPHDIAERLRVAREQAVLRSRQAQARRAEVPAVAPVRVAGRSAALASGPGWWVRLGAWLPLLLLLSGLVLIQQLHERAEIQAAADVDAALLADDLPPLAYHDPGFLEFVKQPEP
jgi:hypothetical protein